MYVVVLKPINNYIGSNVNFIISNNLCNCMYIGQNIVQEAILY